MDHHSPGDEFGPHQRNPIVPAYVSIACLVWVIHDYFVTLEDEVTYFWSQKLQFGVMTFYWIRYYTIFLVLFDTIDIFINTKSPRSVIYSLILGAISLWSIEFVMQLRIYILYNRSKRVALVNGVLFAVSIAVFLWILISTNSVRPPGPPPGLPPPPGHGPPPPRGNRPPPPPGHGRGPPSHCPSIAQDNRRAQWIPATLFEGILFGMAVYKAIVSSSAKVDINGRRSLTAILLSENIVYFFVAACILVFNNLMFVCQVHIPFLGFGPFHAGLGVATGRLLLHLRKFATDNLEAGGDSRMGSRMTGVLPNLEVALPDPPESTP